MHMRSKDARFRRGKYQPRSKLDGNVYEYEAAERRFRREGKLELRVAGSTWGSGKITYPDNAKPLTRDVMENIVVVRMKKRTFEAR